MLTVRETETLRAALLYWREEICPHDDATARPYMDSKEVVPLTESEVARLRDRFDRTAVRYATLSATGDRLGLLELYESREAAEQAAGAQGVATVILPAV